MNKTIKALLHGYILFCCNGNFYFRYNTAKAATPSEGTYAFAGLHVFKGWRCFSARIEPGPAVYNISAEL